MIKKHKALILLGFLSSGFFNPVLSLFIVYKTSQASNIPLVMLFFSTTVLIMEVPSGIFADCFGKKKCYQLSLCLNILSCLVGLLGMGFISTVFFAILMGLGRAFGSGSLDALLINHYMDKDGSDCLPIVSSNINILSGFGMAFGAIIGGYVAINFGFNISLLARIIIYLLIIAYSAVVLKNIDSFEKKQNPLKLTREGLSIIKKNSSLMLVMLFTFTTGIMMNALEMYWQLKYIGITNGTNLSQYIGFVNFLGFSFFSLGSYLGGKYYKKLWHNPRKLYIGFSILLSLSFLILSMQNKIIGFILFFTLWYFILAIANVGEASLLNENVPNHIRATILSLSSFALQVGVLISASMSALIFSNFEINGTWKIIALISMIIFIMVAVLLKKSSKPST